MQKLYNAANERLAGEKARLTRFDAELRDLGEAIDAKKAKIGNGRLERQELIHEIKAFDDNRRAADQKIRALEAEYDWVAEESGRFGRPDTPYDFRGQDIGARKAERKRLQEQFTGLKSQINPKVMATIDATEKREAAVKKRLDIVKRDKDKIVKTVEKLDRYKMQALEEAWHQVNGHFGRFFGELYRGEFARLRPLEGRPITDGLEIQVRLGGIWKESLSELSGGQKYVEFCLDIMFLVLTHKQVASCFSTHLRYPTIQASPLVHPR
jgi:structural maintenance of chromosome 2